MARFSVRVLALLVLGAWLNHGTVSAQPADGSPDPSSPRTLVDDDATLRPAEPDFRLVNLPTTLRLPRHRSNFVITHRFNGNLRRGAFGDQLGSLFGIDEGAVIGLEYRVAVFRRVQAALYRTSFDKTIQLHGRYDAIVERTPLRISVSALASVEGANNLRERRAPALGAIVSRTFADRASIQVSPLWVHGTAATAGFEQDTTFVGIGGRVLVTPSVSLVGEISPRLAGYRPGRAEFAFGIENRVGGHLFQLNFGNSQASTYAQLARGGFPQSLYLGFNIARKFF